jgi:hypothetical protein
MTAIRNLADVPLYPVQSHQSDMGVVPIGLTLAAGVLSDVSGTPESVGLAIAADTLVVKLPPDIGWDADSISYFLVGDNVDQIIVGQPDLTTIRNDGWVKFPIPAAYSGRITGYVTGTTGNKPGSGNRGAMNVPMGDAKARTAAIERSLFAVSSPVEDLVMFPVRFNSLAAGAVDTTSIGGPLGMTVTKGAGAGQYYLDFKFNVPRRGQWTVAGTTSLGKTVTLLQSSIPLTDSNRLELVVKQAGVVAPLAAGEQIRIMCLGPSRAQSIFHEADPSLLEAYLPRRNYVGMFPVCSTIRQPVFDPFNAVIGPTGDVGAGAGSWVPPGTAIYQPTPSGDVYRFDVGTVNNKPPTAGIVNTWAFGNATPVLDTEAIAVDLTTIRTDGIMTFTAAGGGLAPAPDGRLFGYAFLSASKEQ